MSKYYLVNGTPRNAKILSLPKEDSLVKEFDDIADIDLITSKIPAKDAKGTLKIYNEEILRGTLLIMEYPVKKTGGVIYRPFFDETVEGTHNWLNGATTYMEERSERAAKKIINKKVSLELTRDDEFYTLLSLIVRDLECNPSHGVDSILGRDSLITKDFKDQFSDYVTKKYHSSYDLEHLTRSLSNYKALRNFLMEYIAYKSRGFGGLKKDIDTYASEYVNGRVYLNPQMVELASRDMMYHQMTIEEAFKELKRSK